MKTILALKINKCSDSMMWYRAYVGQVVPLQRVYEDCYMSRDSGGYLNIVKLEDAEIVEVEDVTSKSN